MRSHHEEGVLTAALQGRRILLVEDEPLIAMLIEAMLEDAGAVLVGPFGTVESALEAIGHEAFDAALVDLHLGKADSWPIADALARRGAAFSFVTGSGAAALRPPYERTPCLAKPFTEEALLAILGSLLGA